MKHTILSFHKFHWQGKEARNTSNLETEEGEICFSDRETV